MIEVWFVDDEAQVLQGYRRALRGFRELEWKCEFFDDPLEVLRRIDGASVDAIVTDMMMPGLLGVDLLEAVRLRAPATLRVILSGHADRDLIVRSTRVAHQFLSKPCPFASVVQVVEDGAGTCKRRRAAQHAKLEAGGDGIPVLPSHHARLLAELGSSDVDMAAVARLIASDIGMSVRVLQLVNSAFFGLSSRIAQPEAAVRYLGVDLLRAVVVTAGLFESAKLDPRELALLEQFTNHSLLLSKLAGRIAKQLGRDPALAQQVAQAALLHDIGHFLIARDHPALFLELHAGGVRTEYDTGAAETQAIGYSHGFAGARILARWGFPPPVVACVEQHDHPFPSTPAPHPIAVALCAAHAVESGRGAAELPQALRADEALCSLVDALAKEQPRDAA